MSSSQRPPVRFGLGGGVSLTGEGATKMWTTLRRLFGYLKSYWRSLGIVAGLAITGTLLNLVGPILLGKAIDEAVSTENLDRLMGFVLLMLAVYLCSGIMAMLQGWVMVGIGQGFVAQLRSHLFSHIQTLSMDYHDHHKVGDLMSRVSNDTEAINQVISNGLIVFVTNILLLGGIMVAMFLLNWQLALGTATLLPIMLYVTSWITRYSRKASLLKNTLRHLTHSDFLQIE